MAEIFTALGTWVLACITFFLVRGQIKESERATGLQLFAQLTHDFQDPYMRQLRNDFSARLFFYREKREPVPDPLEDVTVLDFLENIAHLTKSEVLEKTIIWNYFSVAVEGYWYAVRDSIADLRKRENDDDLYRDLEWLSEAMSMISARRKGRDASERPTQEKIRDFLASEMKLYCADQK
jgi:hypothetical protein